MLIMRMVNKCTQIIVAFFSPVGRKRGIEKLQDAWNDGQSVEGKFG